MADDCACEMKYMEDTLYASLSKHKKAKGYVYFEVPKDARSIILEYETNYWTEEKLTFVVK